MEKTNSGMQGHGMPIDTNINEQQRIAEKAKHDKRVKELAEECKTDQLTETVSVKDSYVFPFQFAIKEKGDQKEVRIVACGAFMSDKVFKSVKAAQQYLNTKDWELITNLIAVTTHNFIEYEKSQSKH